MHGALRDTQPHGSRTSPSALYPCAYCINHPARGREPVASEPHARHATAHDPATTHRPSMCDAYASRLTRRVSDAQRARTSAIASAAPSQRWRQRQIYLIVTAHVVFDGLVKPHEPRPWVPSICREVGRAAILFCWSEREVIRLGRRGWAWRAPGSVVVEIEMDDAHAVAPAAHLWRTLEDA